MKEKLEKLWIRRLSMVNYPNHSLRYSLSLSLFETFEFYSGKRCFPVVKCIPFCLHDSPRP